MLKFNLIEEIKSIRNAVTQDTPVPGGSHPKKTKLLLLIAILGGAAAAAGAVGILGISFEQGQIPALIADLTGASKHMEATGHIGQAQKPASEPVDEMMSPLLADSKEQAPDEIGRSGGLPESAPATVISRPVAKEAAVSIKKESGDDVWYIRFALCIYKKSCDGLLIRLKKKGVNAYMVHVESGMFTHRAVVGPWPTGAHARDVETKLRLSGFKSSLFAAGGRFYLTTDPFISAERALEACQEIAAMGYQCEKASKKETRKVYKIYEGVYKSKREAIAKRRYYSKQGIDCIVEKKE